MKKINFKNKRFIKGMTKQELNDVCLAAGESNYRANQLYEWMYRHGVSSFESMTNINKSFKMYLMDNYLLNTLDVKKIKPSTEDQSNKILFRTYDNKFIETVSMIDGDRHTVCVSSQIGCALDCSFCATGSMGLKRNLSCGEIVDQLIYVRKNFKHPITNVVFMGMGEPFHNYINVLNSADIFHSPFGFNLASTRITISTVGMLPEIKKFIYEKRRYKLAISLNAATDEIRNQIMPINKKWKIQDIINAGKMYSNQKKRLVMFEYVLLKGINDSESDAKQLAQLLNKIPCKINVIPYNEAGGKYQRPDEDTIIKFSKTLYKNKGIYRVLVRWSKGQDINAGCGQLAGQIV